MAELTTRAAMQVCATTSSRLPQLPIKNGQLIFVRDKCRIAFDYGDQRKFYSQIHEIATEAERAEMADVVSGTYYFVIDTAVLWTYQDKWIQLTTAPEEVIFIGIKMPELGVASKLYIDKARREISVWDSESNNYVVVADYTNEITTSDINNLFTA